MFDLSGTTVNLLVAWGAGSAGDRVRTRLGPATAWRRFTGLVFIGLGLRLALQRRG